MHFQKKNEGTFLDWLQNASGSGWCTWVAETWNVTKSILEHIQIDSPLWLLILISISLLCSKSVWVDPIIHFFHCSVLKKRNSVLKNIGDSTWLSCPNTFQYKQPPKDFTRASEIAIANWQADTFSIFPRQVIEKANRNISILSNGEHIFGRPLCCNCHLMCCTTLYVPLIKKSDTV